jgi:hypothetical protein
MSKLLQELLTLSETVKEKNLIGVVIEGETITEKTKTRPWDGDFICANKGLTSLIGAPTTVNSTFNCTNNYLKTLEGAPSSVGANFSCFNNKLESLKDIHKILTKMNGCFYADNNPIKSHVLGLLLIPGCDSMTIDNADVEDILNEFLPNTRGHKGLLACQSELLDANLEEFAQL